MSHRQWSPILTTFLLVWGCATGEGTPARDGGGGMDGGAPECRSDDDCPDDGVFCNGAEVCREGACVSADPPTCNDGIGCTRDECLVSADECQNTPENSACPEGTVCYPSRGCAVAPPCEFDSDCSGDGNFCNGDDFLGLGIELEA